MAKKTLPKGVSRVQVKDVYGKISWKKPTEINEEDIVQFHPETGEVMVMFSEPGRPGSKEVPFIGKNLPGEEITIDVPDNPPPSEIATITDKHGDALPLVQTLSKAELALKSLAERRKSAFQRDKVMKATRHNPESSKVLDAVMLGLAEEATNLKFEKEELERKGESSAQVSHRRIMALKAVGDTWLKKKEISGGGKGIDLQSKEFSAVFGYVVETFRGACEEAGVRSEMIESIFAIFATAISEADWLAEAKARMDKITNG